MRKTINPTCHAPWTDEQIESINNYQQSGCWFELTCGTLEKHPKENSPFDTECTFPIPGVLIATRDYLYCPLCDYKQYWVFENLTDNTWQAQNNFLKDFIKSQD